MQFVIHHDIKRPQDPGKHWSVLQMQNTLILSSISHPRSFRVDRCQIAWY